MSTGRYHVIDARIVAYIETRRRATFYEIDTHVRPEAEKICEQDRAEGRATRDPWRITDGRLQALRKADKIKFTHEKGWRVVK